MYVVTTMLFVTSAFSAEPAVGFDHSSAQPVGMMLVLNNVESKEAQKTSKLQPETMPVIEQQPSEAIINQQKPQVLIMKELLKDLSAEDRAEFLGSLELRNGWVVSVSMAPLRRTLNRGMTVKILESFTTSQNVIKAASARNKKTSSPIIRLSELLKNVPVDIRNEFFDNMEFKNGALVSVYLGGLRKVMKEVELKKMIKSLASAASADFKVLCGNDVCYYVSCIDSHCLDHPTNACFSNCYD